MQLSMHSHMLAYGILIFRLRRGRYGRFSTRRVWRLTSNICLYREGTHCLPIWAGISWLENTMSKMLLELAHQLTMAGEPFVLATVVWCEAPTFAKPGAQ